MLANEWLTPWNVFCPVMRRMKGPQLRTNCILHRKLNNISPEGNSFVLSEHKGEVGIVSLLKQKLFCWKYYTWRLHVWVCLFMLYHLRICVCVCQLCLSLSCLTPAQPPPALSQVYYDPRWRRGGDTHWENKGGEVKATSCADPNSNWHDTFTDALKCLWLYACNWVSVYTSTVTAYVNSCSCLVWVCILQHILGCRGLTQYLVVLLEILSS